MWRVEEDVFAFLPKTLAAVGADWSAVAHSIDDVFLDDLAAI